MNDDWQSLFEWLSRDGADAAGDLDQARERFDNLAGQSSHRDLLQMIARGAEMLHGPDRLSVIIGATGLMTQIEWSTRGAQLCRELAVWLGTALAEMDLDRPDGLGAVLFPGLPERTRLVHWYMLGQLAQRLLASEPRRDQIEVVGGMCNRIMDALCDLLREQVPKRGYRDLTTSRVALLQSLQHYAGAAKKVNREVGAVFFKEPRLLRVDIWQS